MMRSLRSGVTLAALGSALLLAGCERPPVDSVQRGFRGTAMVEVYNPRLLASQNAVNTLPDPLPVASPDGPKAGAIYQNVKVLGDLSIGEFTRLMTAMTAWVAPVEGCAYCHNLQNLADDSKYTKVVARKMVQMTQHINADWKTHVAATGVTCYTCHRGNNIPQNVWFKVPEQRAAKGLLGDNARQNAPAMTVALASLPYDAFLPYFSEAKDIRVNGTTALPNNNRHSVKQAESTYGLMMHMSQSLGVNCTYCHNSRAFSSWETSTPQRGTAWYGIRMVRDINNAYMEPLTATFPANRVGPTGDVAKANCATCHQGAYKPLYGASMLKDHPELAAPGGTAAATAAAVSATSTVEGGTVYFGVGSATLPTAASDGLQTLINALKASPDTKLAISGFHSAAGDLASNQELAKQRAFTVRDALKAAGIAEDRVTLQKPQSAEANLAGEDPKARRVEVIVKP